MPIVISLKSLVHALIGFCHNRLNPNSGYLEQSLVIFREIGDRDAEMITLLDIGGFCYALAEYSQGLEYLKKILTICREIEDFATESIIVSILDT